MPSDRLSEPCSAGGVKRRSARQRLSAANRRSQIIEATLARLAKHGPEDWTLRQVARDLGIAPSLVTYFFETWGEVLVSAYRELFERFKAEVAEIESAELDGPARLDAIVDLYLGEGAHGETAGAYVALWAFARQEPRLRAEMTAYSETAQAAFARALSGYARERGVTADLSVTTQALYVLLEGFWYDMAVNPSHLSPVQARASLWAFLDAALDAGRR